MKRILSTFFLIILAIYFCPGCGANGNPAATDGAEPVFHAIVDIQGTGDYTSLQAAIDAMPENRTSPWRIFLKNGTYEELVRIPENKPFVYLTGQDREKVIISYTLHCGGPDGPEWEYSYNNPENPAYGTYGSVTIIKSANFYAENITFMNRYGVERQNGPQALAVRSDNDRHAFYNCNMLSFQDTWRTSTSGTADRHYVRDCHIEGAVDYIYGAGEVLVENSTLYNVRSGSVIVAPSHKEGTKWGYVFLNCTVDGNTGAADGGQLLGRPWHNWPIAVYVNTTMNIDIAPEGWTDMGVIPKLFAEYNSRDKNGNPVDLSRRKSLYTATANEGGHTGISETVLTAEEAARYTYENIINADGWNPREQMERLPAPEKVKKNGIKLSWDKTEGAIGYVVLRDGEVVGITANSTFTDSEAQKGERYRYEIKAVNQHGGLGLPAVIR